ncbi:hypothetical protein EYF80_061127 [Liparis tanakae]|uniref:Uncharacterized protein n=1 Tax=Liparis tanakae TaxID=230148 RepID=A0A4Z2EJV4_9TELE|nr:hypothetical protein EYF80_061127 [Liparis tanakae]
MAEHDSDDGMDALMDHFKTNSYKNAFSEDNWQEVTASRDPVHNNTRDNASTF